MIRLIQSSIPLFLVALAGCTALGPYAGAMAQPTAPAAGVPQSPSTAGAPSTAPGASPATAAASPTPSPAATSVSVTIRNSCGKTVRVFFGEKPKFGSGTYSTASGNSVQSHSFRPGDLFWIVDDSDDGVANVEVKDGTKEIEIAGSCKALALR